MGLSLSLGPPIAAPRSTPIRAAKTELDGARGGPRVHAEYSVGNASTILTVSTLTRTTWPTRRTMYSGSSGLFGSLVMPERLSVLIPY